MKEYCSQPFEQYFTFANAEVSNGAMWYLQAKNLSQNIVEKRPTVMQ